MADRPAPLVLCDETGLRRWAVPFSADSPVVSIAVFARFGLTLPAELRAVPRRVAGRAGGWTCVHADDTGRLFEEVLGVPVVWCERCRRDHHAAFAGQDALYTDMVNVATAAATVAYLGDRDDPVARHARRRAGLVAAEVCDTSAWLAEAAVTVLSWAGSMEPRLPSARRRLDPATVAAVAHLAEAADVDPDVRWGLSSAVGLGASPEDLAMTAFYASRDESARTDDDLLAALRARAADIELRAVPGVLSTVAVERRRRDEELWWMSTAAAFLADVVGADSTGLQRFMVALPDGVARLVAARRARGEVVWCLDGPAPATEQHWQIAEALWVPYLDNRTAVTPLQHPQDAVDLSWALQQMAGGVDLAAVFADGWPGTGLELVAAIADDPTRARWLADACALTVQAAMPRRAHLGSLVVALADELPRVAPSDRLALGLLAVELSSLAVEPDVLISTLHAAVRSRGGTER